MRAFLRAVLFRAVKSVLCHRDAQPILRRALANQMPYPQTDLGLVPIKVPYSASEFSREVNGEPGQGPIFITARFRSGSTLVWNLFRTTPGFTAYYEPFNERRWFDPRHRGAGVDRTHLGVSDYWQEYDGLETLGRLYREDWTRCNLFMSASAWNPEMEAYLNRLIEANRQTVPVLQFNRVDFRLPWLKRVFPEARILHVYRNPREQWCSTLPDPDAFPKSAGNLQAFKSFDGFYLNAWLNDLQYRFPFLQDDGVSHPYRYFYLLWLMSYAFGRAYADYSVSMECLLAEPAQTLTALERNLHITGLDTEAVRSAIREPKPPRWPFYAETEWFENIELECQRLLVRSLNLELVPPSP